MNQSQRNRLLRIVDQLDLVACDLYCLLEAQQGHVESLKSKKPRETNQYIYDKMNSHYESLQNVMSDLGSLASSNSRSEK